MSAPRRFESPGEWSREREDALVERILASTTRAERGWRDDATLIASFVVDRLRSSRPLRIAVAASLLLHVTALPVLAWLWLGDEEREPRISFEIAPPEELELLQPEEPVRAVTWPEELEELDEERENRRRLQRFWLTRGEFPSWPASALTDGCGERYGHWLRLRARWGEGPVDAAEYAGSPQRLAAADELELALWAEVWLDAVALELELPEWQEALWARLREVAGHRADGPAAAAVERLRRAKGYGGSEPLAPFRERWVATTLRALRERACSHPEVEAWLQGVVQ